MSLQRKESRLIKAQARFEKYERSHSHLSLNFERNQGKDGKFHTGASISKQTKRQIVLSSADPTRYGVLHRIDGFAKTHITGDIPSVTKYLKNLRPKTAVGKTFRLAARTSNFAVKNIAKTAWRTGLAAESAAIKGAEVSLKSAARSAKIQFQKAVNKNSVDDSIRMSLAGARLVNDARKGLKKRFKYSKKYKLENAGYKLKKAQLAVFRGKTFKPEKKAQKAALRSAKNKYKTQKAAFKKSDKNNVSKALFSYRKAQLRQSRMEIELEKKSQKSRNKALKKEIRKQRRLVGLMRPSPLPLSMVGYGAKRMTASAWQKAAYTDDRNDTMRAADKVAGAGKFAVQHFTSVERAINKQKKKTARLDRKAGKSRTKFLKKQGKLTTRSSLLMEKWKKSRRFAKDPVSVTATVISTAAVRTASAVGKFFAAYSAGILLILMVFLVIFQLLTGAIKAIFANSGWVMGTYTAQDYYLSEAEEYYTHLAAKMNSDILMLRSDNWRTALKNRKFKDGQIRSSEPETANWNDEPAAWIWGQSVEFDYEEAVYDFDPFELWSFLCAYYYDLSPEDEENTQYWKYGGDTEKVIEELFNAEYKFEYFYDNTSHWAELDNYNYYGGGTADEGTYYRCDPQIFICRGEPYKYRIKLDTYTGPITKYFDGDGYICINENYRVLDPNDEYKLTGLVLRDMRFFADDGRKTAQSYPFYRHSDLDNDGEYDNNEFFFYQGDEKHYRSFWGFENGTLDAWFVVSPADTQIWNYNITDQCMYAYYEKYYWKTECILYYNVRQDNTFEEVIKNKLLSMENGDERYMLYEMFLGTAEDSKTTQGNHQTFASPFEGGTDEYIDGGKILNGYGYDMQGFNVSHCALKSSDLHQAADIQADFNTPIYAGFDGAVDFADLENDVVVIRKNKYFYWYDGDGNGKFRDTKIYYYNILPAVSEKEEVKKGDLIGWVSDGKKCENIENTPLGCYLHIKVEIDTNGWGWQYIDPLLVLE